MDTVPQITDPVNRSFVTGTLWHRKPGPVAQFPADQPIPPDPEYKAEWSDWLLPLAELGAIAFYHFSMDDGYEFLDEADHPDDATLAILDQAGCDMFVLSTACQQRSEAIGMYYVNQDHERLALADRLARKIQARAMKRLDTIDDGLHFPSLAEVQKSYIESAAETDNPRKVDPDKFKAVYGGIHHTLHDLGNAKRFADQYRDEVRSVPRWKSWLIWSGSRWREDNLSAIDARAKSIAAGLLKLVETQPDDDGTLAKFAKYTASARGIAAMLSVAKSEPGIPATPDMFDRDAYLLAVENATIDLRTGEARDHRREDLITRLAPVNYIPDAKCPRWLSFLNLIFGGDSELVAFIQRYLGYSLTASTEEHILPILWGDGSNGKSVLVDTFISILGSDFAMKAPADFLIASQASRHPTELAQLFGKRFVAGVENNEGDRLNESRIKELTGSDRIRARRCKEDFWEFRPSHKLILATNHRPAVRGSDRGIWRRLALVPFNVTFWDAEKGETGPEQLRMVKGYERQLVPEYPGILAWLIEGCLAWQRDGLGNPESVRAATAEFRGDQDTIGRFVAECCVTGSSEYTAKAGDLFAAYVKWAEAGREKAILNQRQFGQRIGGMKDENGNPRFERFTSNGVRYRGIALSLESQTGL